MIQVLTGKLSGSSQVLEGSCHWIHDFEGERYVISATPSDRSRSSRGVPEGVDQVERRFFQLAFYGACLNVGHQGVGEPMHWCGCQRAI